MAASARGTATPRPGGTTTVVTFATAMPDTNYSAVVGCSWQTTYLVRKAAASMKLEFGVGCPLSGGVVDWAVFV